MCQTVAEKASSSGYQSVIATSDIVTGATPAAFYAHTLSRYNTAEIENWLAQAPPIIVQASLTSPADYTSSLINQYNSLGGVNGRIGGKPFFWMIEEGLIDTRSHSNDYQGMLLRMANFNSAVQAAVNFVNANPAVTLVVTADHETGGLTPGCVYTSTNHTGANVPLYAVGQHNSMFSGTIENADVGVKIREILFPVQ
jgi:alkaline phosphatase